MGLRRKRTYFGALERWAEFKGPNNAGVGVGNPGEGRKTGEEEKHTKFYDPGEKD